MDKVCDMDNLKILDKSIKSLRYIHMYMYNQNISTQILHDCF